MLSKHSYGGFWRRAVAYSVDKTILQVICLILLLTGMPGHLVLTLPWLATIQPP